LRVFFSLRIVLVLSPRADCRRWCDRSSVTKFPRLGSLSGSLLVPNSVGWGVFLGSSASVSKGTVVPRSTEQRWDVFRPPEPAYSYGRGVFAWLERLSITRRWNPSAHFFFPTKLRPQLAAPNLPLPELRDPLFLPLSTNASWINGLHMRQWIPCTLHTTQQIQQWTWRLLYFRSSCMPPHSACSFI